jgi:hypothetical protein
LSGKGKTFAAADAIGAEGMLAEISDFATGMFIRECSG